jgi:separase
VKAKLKTSSSATKPTASSQSTKVKTRPKPKLTTRDEESAQDADDLAKQVATLAISVTTIAQPSGRLLVKVEDVMRTVNTASQDLSGAIQSGWRFQSGQLESSVAAAALKAGNDAAEALNHLRTHCVGVDATDVERASSSVVGKLVILEMVRSWPSFSSLPC